MSTQGNRFSQTRLIVVVLVLLLLGSIVVGQALAARQAAQLTVAKVTSPAGGEAFPISAVGYQGALSTTFGSPRDIEKDNAALFYVIGHRASKVQVFDSSGSSLMVWGSKGRGDDQLYRPEDLSVYDDGTGTVIYIADTGNNRIQTFTGDGQYLGGWGSLGAASGEFNGPQGVAVAPDGTVYVADTFNHRIQVFSQTGQFLNAWGSLGNGDGEFRYPASVSIGVGGEIYVADSNNYRIQVFAADGRYLRQWGSAGDGPGQFNLPANVHAGSNGAVYVSDTYNNRVQKFTPEGRFLVMWGSAGDGPGQFRRVKGIYADAASHLTYVVDIDNSRIEAFAETTLVLNDGESTSIDLPPGTYDLTEAADDGWTLDAATCDNGNPATIPGGVAVTLTDNVATACTFNNQGPMPTTYSTYLPVALR